MRAARSATERRTLAGLARGLGKLPGDAARAAVETSAGVAGVSLRASIEFLRAAPSAARVLEAEELRAWGEMGRRLVMADVETGVSFFVAGVNQLNAVPPDARPLLFQICARQMALSTSIALETFRRAPDVAHSVGDADVLYAIYEAILEVARRSAKHSAEFLAATPRAIASLQNLDADHASEMMRAGVRLADLFAMRAGGLAADMWAALPATIEGLNAEEARTLFRYAEEFLDRGGAAALHATIAGGAVMRLVPEAFDEWASLTRAVAAKSNASLVGLARISPEVFQALINQTNRERAVALARRAVAAAREVAGVDAEAAILCLRSAPSALRTTTIEQFERWAHDGLRDDRGDARARRS
ncbi:MAG TPA: hypothetical protein VM943_07355 [Pyrinomonadaceae bacterium]|nr:hypothetical protein [Pyrinomonadaceae bacterium]